MKGDVGEGVDHKGLSDEKEVSIVGNAKKKKN